MLFLTLHRGGPYHIETSPLICGANQWTGFYMIGIPVMKELIFCSSYSELYLGLFPIGDGEFRLASVKSLVEAKENKHERQKDWRK